MSELSRRGFMVGCSAAIAAMAGGRLGYVAFGSPMQEPNQEIMIVVFLRGGMDGLSVVMPIAGDDRGYYENNRADIAIPTSGTSAALRLTDFFGLHPAGAPLHGLYQDKKLAIIHAAGLYSDTRSHFDAMKYMELGTPDSKSASTGWLTRHLQTAGNLPAQAVMPALSVGSLSPTSLAGSTEAIGMTSPNGFSFGGNWRYADTQRQMLRDMYAGSSWLHEAGVQTLDAIDVVEYGSPGNYTPENGATYPNNSFGRYLQTVAQMVKLQLGLKVATVDLGGWDTHDSQGNAGGGYFANQFGTLASGLAAFMTDLSNSGGTDHTKRITIVVKSEFGRTFKQNASRGTDHGHGNVMLVLGGSVNGGKVYGRWPGLHTEQLYDRRDLDVTTDYRQVLSEILIRRMGNPNLGAIFPGYQNYQPLQIVQGTDLPPNYDAPIATPTPTPTPFPGSTIPTGNEQRTYLPFVSR
ncbi:MAG: DUF1501 domain-containing protein [Caldilineaceae bacterium]|nr:DUF1501 domain-containing protein [Caldilineaceae bacterium]